MAYNDLCGKGFRPVQGGGQTHQFVHADLALAGLGHLLAPPARAQAAMEQALKAVIGELGAASIKDMGKVMAALKERYAGQMDFARASAMTKDALSPPK